MVPVAEPIARYAVRLVQASRPASASAPQFVRDWVSWGAGTRGAQSLLLGAKARALYHGRVHVSCADVRAVAPSVLRHRILTNFRAEADGITADGIVSRLLESVSEPRSGLT
jgi:MoxR-like ATPase